MTQIITMPEMGESVSEGTITKWLKDEGDRVEKDEPLYEISTDKVDTEVPSPVSGTLIKIKVKKGETVTPETEIAEIDEGNGSSKETQKKTRKKSAAMKAARKDRPDKESESKEEEDGDSRDKSRKSGNGPEGSKDESSELEKEDERHHAQPAEEQDEEREKEGKGEAAGNEEKAESADPDSDRLAPRGREETVTEHQAPRGVKVVPMSPMRRTIARHMVKSVRTSPHVTSLFEVDMSRIVEIREREKGRYREQLDTKLTYLPFFGTAVIHALARHPIVNATVEEDRIVYKQDVNLGIAVSLDDGLIVPVLHKAQDMSFQAIASTIQILAERARAKRLAVDDVSGGTFTITNPGVYGELVGTPIIHQPQVAILGIGAIQRRPVVLEDGGIAARPGCLISLSWDHRAMDGAIAAKFLAAVRNELENWKQPI